MDLNRNVRCTTSAALLLAAGVFFAATPSPVGAETEKPPAAAVAVSHVPKGKQTSIDELARRMVDYTTRMDAEVQCTTDHEQ
jgi:hypothetical protein